VGLLQDSEVIIVIVNFKLECIKVICIIFWSAVVLNSFLLRTNN
jgi:hypothetical protein